MNENIHRVVRIESHWLPTCQCDSCIAERKRRSSLPSSPIRHLSPDAAFHLGYINARNPHGSFAREVFETQQLEDVE